MAEKQILIPNIGDFTDVAIIDVYVKVGDEIEAEDSLLSLESEKAVTDIPSPYSGKITKLHIKEGDLVSKDSLVADIEVAEEEEKEEKEEKKETAPSKEPEEEAKTDKKDESSEEAVEKEEKTPKIEEKKESSKEYINEQPLGAVYHATPSLRQYARELGVPLEKLSGSGPNGRILHSDVQSFVKEAIENKGIGSLSLAPVELEDFSRYGEIERKELSRIQKISGPHLQKSWQQIPHVTQADKADITELEAFRKTVKDELKREKSEVKISILPFIIKAVVVALKKFPDLNSSFDEATKELILKKYYHIGIAVDTPEGLVVPVVKDADKKTVLEIAAELVALSQKARDKKLKSEDLSGASFSISSLGGIGGTFFTPIINPPQVAILGVSKIEKQPVWNGDNFVPRDVLPFSLSYDHRVIDGASGVRFTTYLSSLLSDIKRTLL
jgi:pyruvate dehydrogenase E2 component (dihydrolipoamide acetyltransferase)